MLTYRVRTSEVEGWETKEVFQQYVRRKFGLKEEFSVFYLDEETDQINCSTTEDYAIAKLIMEDNGQEQMQFIIRTEEVKENLQKKQVQHPKHSSFQEYVTVQIKELNYKVEEKELKSNQNQQNILIDQREKFKSNQLKEQDIKQKQQTDKNGDDQIFYKQNQQQILQKKQFELNYSLNIKNKNFKKSNVQIAQKKQKIRKKNQLVRLKKALKEKRKKEIKQQKQAKLALQAYKEKQARRKELQPFVTRQQVLQLIANQVRKQVSKISYVQQKTEKINLLQMQQSMQKMELAGFFCLICSKGISIPFYILKNIKICEKCERSFDSSMVLLKIRDQAAAIQYCSGVQISIIKLVQQQNNLFQSDQSF